MDQQISFVTLAVRDLEASRRPGVDGPGRDPDGCRWEIVTDPGPIGQKVLP